MLTGKIGIEPILLITASIKKIKGATCQRYGDGSGVNGHTLTVHFVYVTRLLPNNKKNWFNTF